MDEIERVNDEKVIDCAGLRSVLIPYRQQLVKLQTGKQFLPPMWLSKNMKWKGWKLG